MCGAVRSTKGDRYWLSNQHLEERVISYVETQVNRLQREPNVA